MSPEVDAIALKAVAPNPDLRYQSAATLAAELRSAGAILDAKGLASEERHSPEPSTSLGLVVIVSAVILLAAGLALWWFAR